MKRLNDKNSEILETEIIEENGAKNSDFKQGFKINRWIIIAVVFFVGIFFILPLVKMLFFKIFHLKGMLMGTHHTMGMHGGMHSMGGRGF